MQYKTQNVIATYCGGNLILQTNSILLQTNSILSICIFLSLVFIYFSVIIVQTLISKSQYKTNQHSISYEENGINLA